MEIAIKFTQEELMIIARGLTFGIIHSDKDIEVAKMQELERKINTLIAVAGK